MHVCTNWSGPLACTYLETVSAGRLGRGHTLGHDGYAKQLDDTTTDRQTGMEFKNRIKQICTIWRCVSLGYNERDYLLF